MNEYRHYRGRGRGNYQHGNNYRNQLSNNIYGGGGVGGNDVRRCNTNHYTPLLPYPPFRETRPRWQRPPQHNNWRGPPLTLGPTTTSSALSPHNRHYPFGRTYSPTNMPKRPASPLPGSEEARQKAIAEASARIKQQLNLAEGDIPFTEFNSNTVDNPADDCIILNEQPMQVNKNQDRNKRKPNNSRRSGNSGGTPTIEELRKKILAQFTYMSKGKIQNLVNNPGSTRYDNALQHLVRDMRLHLSSELRNMYTNRDAEPSDEHNKMIDHFNSIVPDLGIELVSLPDTMVAELSKILQLDVNNEISEMEEEVVNPSNLNSNSNDNENVLVEPEDMFKQAEKLLSSTDFLNVSYDLPNAQIEQQTNVNIDVNNSDSNSVNIYNYPPPNMSTTPTTPTTTTTTTTNLNINVNNSNSNEFHENIRFDEDSIVYDNFFYSQSFTTTNEQNFTSLFNIPPVVPNTSLQQQQQLPEIQQPKESEQNNKLNIPLPSEPEIIKETSKEPEKQLIVKPVEVLRDIPIREDSSPFSKKIQQDPIYENAFKTNICDVNASTITNTIESNTNTNTNINTNTNANTNSNKLINKKNISIKFNPAWVSKLTSKDVSSNQIVKTPTTITKIVPKNKTITTTSTITTTTLTTMTTTTSSNQIDTSNKLNVTSFLQDVITNNLLDLPKDAKEKSKSKSKSSEREMTPKSKHKHDKSSRDFLDKQNKLISETSCESSKSLTERNEEIARPFNRTRSHSPYDHYTQEKTTKNRLSLDERIKEMMKIQETRVAPKTKEPETVVKEPVVTITKTKTKIKQKPTIVKSIETNKNEHVQLSRKEKRRKRRLMRMQKRQKSQLEKQKRIEHERLKEIERLRLIEKEKQKKIEIHQLKELLKRQQKELEKNNKLDKIPTLNTNINTNTTSNTNNNNSETVIQEIEDTSSLTSNLLNLKSVTCNLNKSNNSATSKIPIKLLPKTKSKTVKKESETSANKDTDLNINSIKIKDEPCSEEDSSSSSTSDNEIESSTDNVSDKSNNIIHNLTKDILNPPKSTSIRHFESIDNHLNISTITNTNTNSTIQQLQNFKIIVETNPNPISISSTTQIDTNITPTCTTTTSSTATTSAINNNINESKELPQENTLKNIETTNKIEIESNLEQVPSLIESNSNIESVVSNVEVIEKDKENIIVEKQSEQIETIQTVENINKENNIISDENSKSNEENITTTCTTTCTSIITSENTDSNNTVITTNPVIEEKIIETNVEPINTNKDETKNNEENTKTNDKKPIENNSNCNNKKSETSNSNNKKSTSSNTSSSNKKHRHGSVDRKKETTSKTHNHKRSDSKHKTTDSKSSHSHSHTHSHSNSHSHSHNHSHHSSSTSTLNLSSNKQKILNRLLDIDLQIQKLMQEKWNLYKELNLTTINIDQQLPVTEINSKNKTSTSTNTNTKTNDVLNTSTQTDFPIIKENVIEKHISDVELESTPKKSKIREKEVKTPTPTPTPSLSNTSNKDNSKINDSKIKRKESDINNKRNSRKRKLSESESSITSNILEPIHTNNSEQITSVLTTNEIETKKHTKSNNKTRTTRNSLSINNNNNINNSKTEDEHIVEETINVVPKLKINLLNIKNKANKHAVLQNKDKDKDKEDDEQIIKTSNSKKSKSKKLLETDSNTNSTSTDNVTTNNELISKEEDKILVVNTRQRTTKSKKPNKELEVIQMDEEIPLDTETEIENKNNEDTSTTKRKCKKELKAKVLDDIIEKPITRRRNSRTRNRSSTPSLNDLELNSNPETILTNKRTRKRKNNTETITDSVVVENKKNKLSIKGEQVEIPINKESNEEVEHLLGFDTKVPIVIKDNTIVLEKQEEVLNEAVIEQIKTNIIEEKEVINREQIVQAVQEVQMQEVIPEKVNVEKDDIILTPTHSDTNIIDNMDSREVDVDNKEEEEEENVISYDKLVKSCFVQLERINITLNEDEQEQEQEELENTEQLNDDIIVEEKLEDVTKKEEDIIIKTNEMEISKEIDIIDENGIFCMGHQKSILDIKIIENEFFAASEDGTIYKYCLKSGLLQDAYTGHKRAVTCIYTVMGTFLNIDSMLLYSGSLDCSLKCYNIDTAEVVHTVTVAQAIQCLDSAWGYIFLGTYEGLLFIYNMKKKLLNENSLTIANATVLMIKATQEGSRQVLILASRKREIMVRDAFTGLLLRTMCEQQKPTIYSLLLHQSMVYCGTSDKGILILDFHNGQQINVYNCGKGVVCMLMYRSLLFAGCYDGLIYIYNTKTQKHVCTIKGPGEGMLLSLAITNDVIIAGSKKDHLLKIWKIPQEIFNQIQ